MNTAVTCCSRQRFPGPTAALALGLLMFLAPAMRAQDFSITGWTVDPQQGITLSYPSRTDSYFVLYQGSEITEVDHATELNLGIAGPASFTTTLPSAPGTTFFRLRSIPLAAPLDLDGDGMDDLYEFNRRPQLNPLDQRDAGLDPDRDLLTTVDEYRGGTDPFVSEFATPTVTPPVTPTRASSVFLSGHARPGMQIKVEGGFAPAAGTVAADGTFATQVPLQTNRLNRLFVTGVNAAGQSSAPQPLDVIHDAQPPNLHLDFPTNSQVVASSTLVIAGRVGDLLSGYLGLEVTVTNVTTTDGGPATVDVGIGNNGTYERSVPLVSGANLIRVTATDALGNQTTRQIEINRVEPVGPRLVVVSGDLQRTNVHRRLTQPLLIRLLAPDGSTPLANRQITLDVTRSDGRLLPVDTNQLAADYSQRVDVTPDGTMKLTLRTDAQGQVSAWWTLGADAGCGNNRICVSSAEAAHVAFVCASAEAAPARQINVGTGNTQKGESGAFLAEPLRAWVSDGCNGAQGVPVTFTVMAGRGKLFPVPAHDGTGEAGAGLNQLTVDSSRTGHAGVRLQLGALTGENLIQATWPGNPGRPALFHAYGVARDANQPTTFTGLVLDNTSQPIGNAVCDLVVSGTTHRTFSDSQGRFRFTNLVTSAGPGTPTSLAGPAHLYVNGQSANSLGTNAIPTNLFPALHFTTTLVPNAANSLPTPVLLPCLNTNNARLYDGTADLVLTCEGIGGLEMTIAAHSMRHPNGTPVTPEAPALVSLNPVHYDKVPMPMPDGAAPLFAWTLQPGGAHFDPPVQVSYPNLSALAPGSIANFLSFNHDTERFEIVSSAHVLADGSRIVSDPGSGISVAGWGGNCPPYEVTEDVEVCEPKNATPSPDDYVFEDIPYRTEEDNRPKGRGLCGLTQSDRHLLSWCECDDAGNRTIPRVTMEFRVTDKWVWAAITDPADIAFVTEHENRHVEAWRDFFDLMYEQTQDFNGVRLASEADCTRVIEDFDAFVEAELEITTEIQRNEIDNLEETLKCILLQLKYAFGPEDSQVRPADAEDERMEDFILTARRSVWNVNANGQSALVANPRSFRMRNLAASDSFGIDGPGTPPDFLSDDLLRITGSSTDQGTNLYFATEFFQLRTGQRIAVTNITFTGTPPRIPDSLQAIPELPTLTQLGQTTRVRTVGRYADGSTADLSSRNEGTTYRVSNPAIATVDRNGIVTAHRAGFVLVAVSNQGATAATPLLVSPGDSLTRFVGRVQRVDGTPIDGAVVSISGYAQGLTGPDGRFAISGVPAALGPLTVAAFGFENGVRLTGVVRRVAVQPGGDTESSTVTLKPESLRNPSLAAGIAHTLALRIDGSLWAWGVNNQGQLGDGTSSNRRLPVQVGTGQNWASVAAGSSHTVALQRDGSLWTWGANSRGQLGDGTISLRRNPTRIGVDRNWLQVDAGGNHTVALAEDGSLWTWGDNPSGQLGNGTTTDKNQPTRIGTDTDWRWISAGNEHTAALKQDGTLWAWGENSHRQVGNGSPSDQLEPVRLGTDTDWWLVVAGGFHTVALKKDGTLWAWGDNAWGQIGNGSFVDVPLPLLVSSAQDWATIAAGLFHTSALKLDGSRWAWGQNSEGELGNERRGVSLVIPFRIGTTIDWVETSAGSDHTVGLTADSRLWTWGNNDFGALGNTQADNQSSPVRIGTEVHWKFIATGDNHGLGLTENGGLTAWGFNFTGQVGDGTFDARLSPVAVSSNSDWAEVEGGTGHTAAVKTDGTLWTWGENLVGQLGSGSSAPRNAPAQVGAESDWSTVAAGNSHTLGIRSGGRLWAWGSNIQGQLGDGSNTTRRDPVPIGTEPIWSSAAAGARHSVGLQTDGSLWTWGDNGQGQLGSGDRSDLVVPTRIGDNTLWTRITAGRDHTAAIRSDGSIWVWGDNSSGQLGDGTLNDQLIPLRIGTDSDWRFVAAGGFHTVGIKLDGTLWAWGENGSGQLGDGTLIDRRLPVPVGTDTDWVALAAGSAHTLALKADGTLWAWGANQNGQLAPGAPIPVLPATGWGAP